MSEVDESSISVVTMSVAPGGQRKWRNFLINKRMQLKYTLGVALVAALVGIALGSLAYRYSRDQTQALGAQLATDQGVDAELARELMSLARQEDMHLAFGIGVGVMLVVLSIFIVGILVTHRFAGPGFRLARIMDEIGAGHFTMPAQLRKRDELKEIYDALFRMVGGLRRMQTEDIENMERILSSLRQQKADPEIVAKVEALSQKMRSRVSG